MIPTPSPFEATVRMDNGAATVDLWGKLDGAAERELNNAYGRAESLDNGVVTLNFSQVTYINSTGIALIVGLLARARKSHHRLVVYGLSEHYMEIFRITRLSDFMSVCIDEASAARDREEHKEA